MVPTHHQGCQAWTCSTTAAAAATASPEINSAHRSRRISRRPTRATDWPALLEVGCQACVCLVSWVRYPPRGVEGTLYFRFWLGRQRDEMVEFFSPIRRERGRALERGRHVHDSFVFMAAGC